jgi:orotate phosphoribosyltransferase
VSDIGDVHHVLDGVTVPLQHALQKILEEKGAEVADVLIVVHRRSARVETGSAGDERLESAPLARVVVVQHQRCWHRHFQKKSRQYGLAALSCPGLHQVDDRMPRNTRRQFAAERHRVQRVRPLGVDMLAW